MYTITAFVLGYRLTISSIVLHIGSVLLDWAEVVCCECSVDTPEELSSILYLLNTGSCMYHTHVLCYVLILLL